MKTDTASRIIELRRSQGLTQPQFAAALGCSLSTLIKWENGIRLPSGAAARLLTILYHHPNSPTFYTRGPAKSGASPSTQPRPPYFVIPTS